jgi:2-polyprenyl-3-methyl-5-hydroxy-6-metoxy-1,4-benzoquinol methylase
MNTPDRQAHWQNVYTSKGEREVSWFQDSPTISLELIAATGADPGSAIVDIGGGASRLVDALVTRGYQAVTVLDLSEAALRTAKDRIGQGAQAVTWIAADVTTWEPTGQYDVWHDRAAFHFLTDPSDREAYKERLTKALRPGGQAIIGTFSLQGPEKCSGLPVVRYDARNLGDFLGPAFRLMETRDHEHRTPWGSSQQFQFSRFVFDGVD